MTTTKVKELKMLRREYPEIFLEYIWVRIGIFVTTILCVTTIFALHRSSQIEELADIVLSRTNQANYNLAERIPVEDVFWHYIEEIQIPTVGEIPIDYLQDANEIEVATVQLIEEETSVTEAVYDCTQAQQGTEEGLLQSIMQVSNNVESLEITTDFKPISSPTQNVSEDEVYILAQLMYAEEGVFFKNYDEDPALVEYVLKLAGSVVIHRMQNNYLGSKTIQGVIYKEGQYAQQTLDRINEGQDIPEIVYQWAEEILQEPLGPNGLIYQAEFEQGVTFDHIGNQYFGVESKYN